MISMLKKINDWNNAHTKFISFGKDDNDFGLTEVQNLQINELISILGHHHHNSISLDDWKKVPKRNIFFLDGFYYYHRWFGESYYHNTFSTYEDMYDYIYIYEFVFVLNLVDYHPLIKKEIYINVVKNTNLTFEIDDYWIFIPLFLFWEKVIFPFHEDSESIEYKNRLMSVLDIVITKCNKKDFAISFYLGKLYPIFINYYRSLTIKKIKSNVA